MADFEFQEKSKRGRKAKKALRVDMTPMVDLGFLMIAFFMFTTNFSKPNVIDLSYPPENSDKITNEIDYRNSITFILGEDGRVFYYQEEKKNLNLESLKEISFYDYQIAKAIDLAKKNAPKPDYFTVIIKPTDNSQYKSMVDMLDELAITKTTRYGISELNDTEKELCKKKSIL